MNFDDVEIGQSYRYAGEHLRVPKGTMMTIRFCATDVAQSDVEREIFDPLKFTFLAEFTLDGQLRATHVRAVDLREPVIQRIRRAMKRGL